MKLRVATALVFLTLFGVVAVAGLGIAILVVRYENGQLAGYCAKDLPDSPLPFDGSDMVHPLDKKAPEYAGAAPHSVYVPGPGDKLTDYKLPEGWAKDPWANGPKPTPATLPQLYVCEYELSRDPTTSTPCGNYTGHGSTVALTVQSARFRYEVREARTAKVLGSFELASAPFDEKLCPGIVYHSASSSPDAELIPAADAQFTAALKPYVLKP
ncbi:hypothetical protein [Kribbella sp. NPDC051770]|uniref:hypothetical protein n=1 Tax=Kribbella sp. NPDC051770 TaxID=3155413 RepID=UPI003442DFBE